MIEFSRKIKLYYRYKETKGKKDTFSQNWQDNHFHGNDNEQWRRKAKCQSCMKGHSVVFVRQSNRFVIAIKSSLRIGIRGQIVVVEEW